MRLPSSSVRDLPSGVRAAAMTRVPNRSLTPSRTSASATSRAASDSSFGSTRGSSSIRSTCVPSLAKACASSQPTGPPPSTARRRGCSARSKIVSFVSGASSRRPRSGGTQARAPVAMSVLRVRSVAPATAISCALTKLASPIPTTVCLTSNSRNVWVKAVSSVAPLHTRPPMAMMIRRG